MLQEGAKVHRWGTRPGVSETGLSVQFHGNDAQRVCDG